MAKKKLLRFPKTVKPCTLEGNDKIYDELVKAYQKKIGIMNPKHPDWDKFLERMEGKEGCNFKKNKKGQFSWTCRGGRDKTLATKILKSMQKKDKNIDIPTTLAYFDSRGGHCDCEIVFNVATN